MDAILKKSEELNKTLVQRKKEDELSIEDHCLPPQKTDPPKRLIRIREVIKLTGISKSYIYQLVSKNLFPKAVQLIKGGSSVAWVEGEINEWIDSRIQERNQEVGRDD